MGKTALIIVDYQNDFLPDGSLAVKDGRDCLAVFKDLLNKDEWDWDVIIASQDYHPKGHISFASTHGAEPFSSRMVTDARGKQVDQTMWPDHCVIGTKGAEIDRDLRHMLEPWKDKLHIVRKGQYKGLEAYSAFLGELNDPTHPKDDAPKSDGHDVPELASETDSQLARFLRTVQVESVVLTGVAMDICVIASALSAIRAGFKTSVLAPATKAAKPDEAVLHYVNIKSKGGQVLAERGGEWESELREWMH